MKSRLDQIEARLQTLIEGSAALLMRGNLQHRLAHQLVGAIQENMLSEPDGLLVAPGEYTIYLHPDLEAYWQAHHALLDSISRSLLEAAREYGISFLSEPLLHLAPDEHMTQEDIQVQATHHPEQRNVLEQTFAFPVARGTADKNTLPPNPFLIVDGSRVFPLDRSVINIGRRSDNHLVLPDPRVSRTHAQLRAVRGQFILFDLNSTGGTMVNGQRVVQHTLKPGDVISLSGVPLIYGEDVPPDDGQDDLGSTRTMNTKG